MRLTMMIGAAVLAVFFAVGNNFDYRYAGVLAGLSSIVNGLLLSKSLTLKSTPSFSQKEKILDQVFKRLQADKFRYLLKLTEGNTPATHTTLTTKDQLCDSLFYLLQGKMEISKGDKLFTPKPMAFIGEVGCFLHLAASATTIVE
ncbi:MAG: hypothetical protein ACI854_002431 [Arenicella sp.]|jgi:hypothetical protein